MTPQRISALERRTAAIHEAGHYAIARRLGHVAASVHIFRTGNMPTMDGDRAWVGKFEFWACRDLSPMDRRMIGCAGSVAEFIWRGETPEPDYWAFDVDAMSPSDWQLCECEPAQPDQLLFDAIWAVSDLLKDGGGARAEWLAVARRLIVAARPK